MKKTIGPFLNQKIALPIGAFSLAILLWVFVVSENEYTMIIDLPIEARNLNVQKAHKEEVPNFAAVRLKGRRSAKFCGCSFKRYGQRFI